MRRTSQPTGRRTAVLGLFARAQSPTLALSSTPSDVLETRSQLQMKTFMLAAVSALLPVCVVFGQADQSPAQQPAQHQDATAQVWVHKTLTGWPQDTQKLAVQLVSKYGQPNETTDKQLTWYDNGPWKRTVLHKEEIRHDFPMPHKDILEQTVNYRVPTEKFSELAQYNGSVVANRTQGELSVRCDSEEANLLALNLADDIVKGERTVEQARAFHAQVIRGRMINEPEAYLQSLRLKPPKSSAATADPGEVAPLIRHMSESD